MATPDEVRASLLAVADHGRDGVARRKVAEQVRSAVEVGARLVEASAADPIGPEGVTAGDVATAASAVVLASDLRAPDAVDFIGHVPNVPDWRKRLAKVERLLSGPAEREAARYGWVYDDLETALAEVRAMLEEGE